MSTPLIVTLDFYKSIFLEVSLYICLLGCVVFSQSDVRSNIMTISFHKTIFISGLITFLVTSSMYCQSKYIIFSENRLGNYKLLHFVKDSDSILIITKSKILTNKIETNIEEIVSGKIGKKISNLKTKGQIFWFYYKIKSQNGFINSGYYSPNEVKEKIYTYRSFPILIEKFP